MCAVNVKKDFVAKLNLQLDRITQIGVIGVVTWVETLKPSQYLVGVRFHSMPEASRTKLLKFINNFAPST